MSIRSQLSTLIQLANIDGEFAGEEKMMILMIGKANGVAESEIMDLVKNPEPIPPLSTMTSDDRFEYLYNIVQLMKIDSQVYLSEIKYCEELAEKLGFKRSVISALSSRIFSDPSITSNRDALKKVIKKYEH
ncbi:TerB family tellurite resistance protein [Marinoscillum sp. MHG1-6]|uniref:TerB family tellurite resistance protein n=1 Tax=Marinoscillum sp. MHG1-6 TaxID=2959627 RepID=UPI002158892A|nr:TerB family tellurite resistance protein [Marinoscillum sp. MHG1-6]